MPIFIEGQRWISEPEPELGLGTILNVENGRVRVAFTASSETRLYASENAPLQRVRFNAGDRITTHENKELRVTSVAEENGLLIYQCGEESIPETLLSDLLSFDTAERRLFSGLFDDLSDFRLRYQTLMYQYERRRSPLSGFLGGRIDLIPHQLFIASEVSSRLAPRVLLSDEVGLGKTIEACLILHRLLLSGKVKRVIIAVPDSLVHQWFIELLRKFNLWFHIFDEERCQALEADNPESNPFFDDQLVLCSLSFLSDSPERSLQVLQANWDLLIVDEAHHLEWTPEEPSKEYLLVEALSGQARGLLLLTATPEQLGIESHFARLRLLDPNRYTSLEAFRLESVSYKNVAEVILKIISGGLSEKTVQQLNEQLGHPEDLKGLNPNFSAESTEGKVQIRELLDLYGPGRVIFRNTRSVISGFPKRKAHLIPLKGSEQDYENTLREIEADAGLSPSLKGFHLDDDPRLLWLVRQLGSPEPAKILVICSTKEKAIALHQAIRDRINVRAAVFHEALSLVQRDRNAAWFSESDGARILVSSEIGSEGRNFQYAHNLVLFDLPLQPGLLEQRIGRLDRIGQKKDIEIHVPFLARSPQEVIARWYHEGLNAFEHNLAGGHLLRAAFGDDVLTLALSFSKLKVEKADLELKRLISKSKNERKKLASSIEKGRDRLLELNSFREDEATSLIDRIRTVDANPDLERYLLSALRNYGIQAEELTPRTYVLNTRYMTTDAFPALPEERSTFTFIRSHAIAREEIGFLTWDHPVVTGTMDLVLGSEKGNCSIARWPEPDTSGILLECLFVLEAVSSSDLNISSYLPPTPIRIVVDHALQDLTTILPTDVLDTYLVKCQPAAFFEEGLLPATHIEKMLASASKIAQQQGDMIQKDIEQVLKESWTARLERLLRLKSLHGHVRQEEIEQVKQLYQELGETIQNARIRLDAIRLIIKK